MNELKPEQNISVEIVSGIEGLCLLVNDYRVAGPKPWGGGKVVHSFQTKQSQIDIALHRAQPANEPLALDEMNALDHEPIYVLHTGGKWTMNGWHIATASSYQNHGRCDLEIDNGKTTIDMQNYGKTWLAYRRPPEMFIGVDLASGHDFTAYGRPPERSGNDG
jgi:hypothetical protein